MQKPFHVLPVGFNRLAIFLCYDKDGIIDDYIPYLLRDLKENLSELVVAVNGKLSPEGRQKLEEFTEHIYIRENKGADAGGWKDAMIHYIGWDKLAQYDEIILLNDSFYGPFYPFSEVFQEMDKKEVDFWGLMAHGEENIKFYDNPYPYLPKHVQSYFIAIRKRMHSSPEFKKYWEKMPYFTTVQDAISKHETVFTKYFNDLGYKWDVFIETSDLDGDYPESKPTAHCFLNTYELIKNRRCPVLKRHCFGFSYQNHLSSSNGMHLRQSVEYIASKTSYDISLIYKNIIRLYNIADIFYNLQLSYVLPKQCKAYVPVRGCRAVLVIHIEYLDSMVKFKPLVCELPEFVDVIISTEDKKGFEVLKSELEPHLGERVKVLVTSEKGSELSGFFITAAPYLHKYDYIGFCHDAQSVRGEEISTVGDSLQELMVENVMGSSVYVENILSLLEGQPSLGLLCVPPPRHARYALDFLNPWNSEYEATEQLVKKLQLHAKVTKESMPLMNEMAFWCKRDALLLLLNHPWEMEDFIKSEKGNISEPLRKVLPFAAQHQGYLTGWVMTDDYARAEMTNVNYILGTFSFTDLNDFKFFLIQFLKKNLPKPLLGPAKRVKRWLGW